MEHSEFPWGVEDVPGLLTPLGVLGWIAAAVLALVLMNALRNGGDKERRGRGRASEIAETYDMILAAARYALSLDDYGVLGGANLLRNVVQTRLGRVLKLGGEMGKHLKAISEAMGEKDKGKDHKPHKPAHAPAPSHGGGHGAAAAASRGAALAAVGNNVHGPSITVNVGLAERPDAVAIAEAGPHGAHEHAPDNHGHDDHHHDDHDKPLTLEEQLLAVRKAVREFEVWWSNRAGRIGDMEDGLKDFTHPEPLDDHTRSLLKIKNERT